MVEFKFSISNEAFELLEKISHAKAEYRDTNYETIDDFLASDEHLVHNISLESFKARNNGGTYHLIIELENNELVECDGESWHLTYVLTNFGERILKNHK